MLVTLLYLATTGLFTCPLRSIFRESINRRRSLVTVKEWFGDVTRASAPAHHTSWTSRSPTEKKLQTSVEHGVELDRCHRSTQGNNCCHGHSIYLRVSDGLAVTADACRRTFIYVSSSFCHFWDSAYAEEKGGA